MRIEECEDCRNAIATHQLQVKRGTFQLGPIDLAVKEGEIFALLGRTGSGKTVLLETLAGFYQEQYTGDVYLFGENAQDVPPDQRDMGFVYQDSGLFPHMTVEQNIAYANPTATKEQIIQAAVLAMDNICISSNDGIIEDCIEKTICNLGRIGAEGMQTTDRMILDIMVCK